MKAHLLASLLAASLLAGCSSAEKEIQPEFTAGQPTIINAYATPSTVVLNRDLHPSQPAKVVAEVKDFGAMVTDVRLRFRDVPLEIPLDHVIGSTWQAELTPRQLQALSVRGKTARYEADVIAHDDKGEEARSEGTVALLIRTPSAG
jgi:hypothetical protein